MEQKLEKEEMMMADRRARIVRSSALSLVALLLCAGIAMAEPILQPYMHGMALGNGVDLASSENKQSCVAFQTTSSNPPGAIRSANWYWDLAESNASIMEMTGVNAGASVSRGLARASVETSLLMENQLSSYDVNVLSLVEVELRWDYATQVQLKPEFQKMMMERPDQFIEQCGNYYVSGVLHGGSFYNLITMSTTSRLDRDKVAVKVGGGYGPFAASAKVSQETLNTLAQRRATIKGYSTGSGGAGIPLDINAMQSRVTKFPTEVLSSGGTLTQVVLEEYPRLPAAMDPKISRMALARWAYASIRREIDFIEKKPEQFYMDRQSWMPRIAQLKSEAKTAQDSLDEALAACRQDLKTCAEPKGLRDPALVRADLPPRYEGVCGTRTFDMRNHLTTAVHPLTTRCGGDMDLQGETCAIAIDSRFVPLSGGKQVDQYTKVEMRESRKNGTCFRREQTRTLIYRMEDLFPGCYMDARNAPNGHLSARAAKGDLKWNVYEGNGIIKSAECLAYARKRDFGKVGCKTITFLDTIPITLLHDEDRKGPNVYRPEPATKTMSAEPAKSSPQTVSAGSQRTAGPSGFTRRVEHVQKSTGKNVATPARRALPGEPASTK